jgi:hypothetical protein
MSTITPTARRCLGDGAPVCHEGRERPTHQLATVSANVTVKLSLSLCLIMCPHHEDVRGLEVALHVCKFSTFALDGDKYFVSRPSHFTPEPSGL